MRTAVELRNVSAGYEPGDLIIQDINLTVKEKEFLGIIGPNGGGKTTLLKIILGLIQPSKGEVLIYNEPVNFKDYKIGYVPQYSNFDKTFPISVKDVVSMGLISKKIFRKKLTDSENKKVMSALEQVNLLKKINVQINSKC
jgi:zinc transport system ATP-binding protein